MKRLFVLLCVGIWSMAALADAPTVPGTIRFAGLNLKLNEKARKKIQAEVNALTKSPKYFQIKVDRLQIYFPIIERVFREEDLPEDFKYLVLQESALISDAVSTSNAVGFWQFKQDAAVEVGLRIDRNVDERLNIVASTRGAARYLKKNNRLYFDNWVHALLAYNQGPGGALKMVNDKYNGVRSMPIDGQTHWYVIKFLAHKVAFEQVQSSTPQLHLVEYYEGQDKTLREISQITNLEYSLVENYNKWLKRGKVPTDKPYAVILPYSERPGDFIAQNRSRGSVQRTDYPAGTQIATTGDQPLRTQQDKYPIISGATRHGYESKKVKINGIPGIMVGEQDDLEDLSRISGVSIKRLLYYNDFSRKKDLSPGELWYLKSKRSKAKEHYHVVEPNETLWSISQKYGIKLSKLRQKNRLSKRQQVKPGRVLWLRFIRPSDQPVAYQKAPEPPEDPVVAKRSKAVAIAPSKPVKSAPSKPVAIDTTRRRQTPVKVNQDIYPSKERSTVEKPATVEEQEFELEEPVNFVGVDKSKNVTNSLQKVHVVQPGETLYGISKKYEIRVAELKEMNDLGESNGLKVGQELKIQQKAGSKEITTKPSQELDNEFIYHEVKPGETLYQIARDYEATIKQLMDWNQKSDFNISIGEKLKLRKPE